MVRAIEGVYRDGKIELTETPQNIGSSRVYVVFVPEGQFDVKADAIRALAVKDLVTHMKKGYKLGGAPYPTREEIHERGGGQ